MHHQYGISEVFAQKSFHRETSGVVVKCQLFSQALLYSVQKKFTSCTKWMAGFWVMPPSPPLQISNTARSMYLLLTGFQRSKMPRFPIMLIIIVLEVVYTIILEEEG